MKYAQTIHLTPPDLVEIISKHLNIPTAQIEFKILERVVDRPGDTSGPIFVGADIRVPKEDDRADVKLPLKPNK